MDVHPPLYYGLLHAWMRLVGDSEYALRALSALLSVMVVPAMWQLGGRLGGWRAATVAALMVALAPAALTYGREARMYGPSIALAALTLAAAELVAARPGSWLRWLPYTVVSLLALATHYAAVAVVVAAAMRLAFGGRWLMVHGAIVAVSGAWGLHLWANRDAWLGRVWHPWASRTAAEPALVDWVTAMAGLPVGPERLSALGPQPLAVVGLVSSAALFGIAGLATWRRWLAMGALLALAVGPPLVLLAAQELRPGWNVRYTLVGLPAVLALAAVGAAALPRTAFALLAALLVASQLPGLQAAMTPSRQDWRAAAAAIAAVARADDVALGSVQAMAAYHLRGSVPTRQRPIALGRPPEEVVAELDAATRGKSRVWLLPAHDPLLDPADLMGTALGRYANARATTQAGGLEIARFDLRPRDRLVLSAPLRQIDATFGESVRLVAYAATHGPAGADLSLELRIERQLTEEYKLFAHLLDASGRTIGQQDVLVVDSIGRPTSQLGEGTRLRLDLTVGDGTRAAHAFGVGLYQLASPGARLALSPAAPEHRLVLLLRE